MNLHNQRVQHHFNCAPLVCRMPKAMPSTTRRNSWNMTNTVFYDCFWCNKIFFFIVCKTIKIFVFDTFVFSSHEDEGSQVAHLHLKCADCGREGFYLRVGAWTTQYFALAETGVRQMFFFYSARNWAIAAARTLAMNASNTTS